LGHDCTLSAWQTVYQGYDDELLLRILSGGWSDVAQDQSVDLQASIARLVAAYFPLAIEGVSPGEARLLAEEMPPISQIRHTFPSLSVQRETTTYEALHLFFDGPAKLTEALIQSHGKQGELIAYDLVREGRIKRMGGATGSVSDFMAGFFSAPQEADMYTAGLEEECVRRSDQEVVVHIKECEWARYFRERHPQVGYLMACSTDEAAYRSFNESLRLQRTSTLMEGGKVCDFRVFAAGRAPD
jgi:hypothetical protein